MCRVCLVDDSQTILMSVSKNLERAGLPTDTFADPQEALAHFQNGGQTDLLITDLNMPGMDGIALIKELRKVRSMRFKPILFLTTESEQAKKQEAKAAGASGWLVKPVQGEELLAAVRQLSPVA